MLLLNVFIVVFFLGFFYFGSGFVDGVVYVLVGIVMVDVGCYCFVDVGVGGFGGFG